MKAEQHKKNKDVHDTEKQPQQTKHRTSTTNKPSNVIGLEVTRKNCSTVNKWDFNQSYKVSSAIICKTSVNVKVG